MPQDKQEEADVTAASHQAAGRGRCGHLLDYARRQMGGRAACVAYHVYPASAPTTAAESCRPCGTARELVSSHRSTFVLNMSTSQLTSSMDVIYDPLPQGKYIRLLEVWVDSRSHELVGKFKLISLDDCTQYYTAISYAWENPAPVSRIGFPDGRSLSLSQTLSGLFDSLRKRHDAFTVWIDALCINQKDLDERASQVRLMGKVYSSAEQVLLWLGASTQETKDAFRFIESKQTLSWPEDWDKEKDFSGLRPLFSLLERPWFQRVWVIQEVTLSDNVLMACGEDTIDFDNLRLCLFGLWKFFEGWYDYDEDDAAVRGLWCMTRPIFIRDEFQDSGAVRQNVPRNNFGVPGSSLTPRNR